jgi:hypothetical protein
MTCPIRPAGSADADFLTDMLEEAVDWSPDRAWSPAAHRGWSLLAH